MKKGLLTILAILIILIGWMFWATSGHLNEEELSQITASEDYQPFSNDTISIMTYNIGWLSGMTNNRPVERSLELYQSNTESLLKLLETHQIDILAMQEIDFDSNRSFNIDQLELIKEGLNYPFTAKAVNWDKRYVPYPSLNPKYHFGKVISGQALVSRYQILSNTIEILEKPVDQPFHYKALYLDRLIQTNRIAINDQEITVMNVHLEAFSEATRALHIEYVFDKFQEAIRYGPVILLGDFNESYLNNQKHLMTKFYNHPEIASAITLDQLKANLENHYTFSSQTPDRKIDFIFYSTKFIEMLDAKTIIETQSLSDHLPVYMRFRLKTINPDLY